MLLALAGVDGKHFVGESRLFEKERDLGGIGCRVKVETDHGLLMDESRAGTIAAASIRERD